MLTGSMAAMIKTARHSMDCYASSTLAPCPWAIPGARRKCEARFIGAGKTQEQAARRPRDARASQPHGFGPAAVNHQSGSEKKV